MLALVAALVLAAPPANLKAKAEPGLRAITGAALSSHVRFLADDLLEGRATGSRGHALAARYLAAQLQALGLSPAGEGGTYFQKVPLRAWTLDRQACAFSVEVAGKSERLVNDTEVLFGAKAASAADDAEGGLVFVGYGISAPEYGYEDVPKDLTGKIALVLVGAPRSDRDDFFPIAASAVYSDRTAKLRLLASRGAIGAVFVLTPEWLQRLPWAFFLRNNKFEGMAWVDGDKPGDSAVLPTAIIAPEQLDRLLTRAGKPGESARIFAIPKTGRQEPLVLDAKASLRVRATVRELTSENVAAVLPGSDPKRKAEHVVFTAHLDHLGIGEPVNGDAIYNGAMDDAGGVAALIEIARAFAALPKRPARSILILGVTGEEKGLQGSSYYAKHPTVPLAQTVADINSDGPGGSWEPHDLHGLGAEHSSLLGDVRAACAALGLKVTPDPSPEEVFFIRSDQYSFVRQGVPSVFPTLGWQDAKGDTKANKALDEIWETTRYHQPSDEWNPKQNWDWTATEVRAYFLIGLSVALTPERPTWNKGSVFARPLGNR